MDVNASVDFINTNNPNNVNNTMNNSPSKEQVFADDIDNSVNNIIAKMISIAKKSNEDLETFLLRYFKDGIISDLELFKAFLLTKLDLNENEINKIITYFSNPENVHNIIRYSKSKNLDNNNTKSNPENNNNNNTLNKSNGFMSTTANTNGFDMNKMLDRAKDVPKLIEEKEKELKANSPKPNSPRDGGNKLNNSTILKTSFSNEEKQIGKFNWVGKAAYSILNNRINLYNALSDYDADFDGKFT